MSALNNLRKKGTSPAMEEDELLPERVRSFPCLYDKTCKEHNEKDAIENAWLKVAEELDFIGDGKHSGFFCIWYCFCFFILIFLKIFTLFLFQNQKIFKNM